MSTAHPSTAVAISEPHELVTSAGATDKVMALLAQAVERGISVEALSQLVDLHEKVQRRDAELEFSRSLVAFQTECPVIPKSSTAKIATNSGVGYEYTFADFEQIVETIRPHLTKHGFSFSFDASATQTMLRCVCTLHHRNGHSVTSAFELPTENKSGATPQQKFGGALTYAKRMTLISVLGLTLGDPDPDAGAANAPITEEQAATLAALIDEAKPNRERFDKHFGITRLADMRASRYLEAVRMLEAKRKAVKP